MVAMKHGKKKRNKEKILELKDKLNLLWKFLFLAVFTYGVISLTCCKKSCSSCCKETTQSCKNKITTTE